MRVTLSAVKRIMYRETRPETAPAMATCCFEAFSRGRGNRDAQLDSSRFLSHPLFSLVHAYFVLGVFALCVPSPPHSPLSYEGSPFPFSQCDEFQEPSMCR